MNECNLSMISCELLMMIDNRNGNITILEILCKLCFAFVNYYAFSERDFAKEFIKKKTSRSDVK